MLIERKIFPSAIEIIERYSEEVFKGTMDAPQILATRALVELKQVARTMENIARLQARIFQNSERADSTEQTKGEICPHSKKICEYDNEDCTGIKGACEDWK